MSPEPNDPFLDPFEESVTEDPFVEDHFGGRTVTTAGAPVNLQDSSAVLVLGVLSILGGFCYGIMGLIFGIVALALAAKPERLYQQEPTRYTPSSYSNLRAGKICAVIGLVISILIIILVFAIVITTQSPF